MMLSYNDGIFRIKSRVNSEGLLSLRHGHSSFFLDALTIVEPEHEYII